MAEYPGPRHEPVRGLIVQSAQWTPRMEEQTPDADKSWKMYLYPFCDKLNVWPLGVDIINTDCT